MLAPAPDYETLIASVPLAHPCALQHRRDVCDRWAAAEPDRVAVLDVAADGRVHAADLQRPAECSNRLAHALRERGVARGDPGALLLPQGTAVADRPYRDLQARRRRAPARGPVRVDALEYRLKDAGAKAIVTNAAGVAKLRQIGDGPGLQTVISVRRE
jgi:acetyl-CoA synthetase